MLINCSESMTRIYSKIILDCFFLIKLIFTKWLISHTPTHTEVSFLVLHLTLRHPPILIRQLISACELIIKTQVLWSIIDRFVVRMNSCSCIGLIRCCYLLFIHFRVKSFIFFDFHWVGLITISDRYPQVLRGVLNAEFPFQKDPKWARFCRFLVLSVRWRGDYDDHIFDLSLPCEPFGSRVLKIKQMYGQCPTFKRSAIS